MRTTGEGGSERDGQEAEGAEDEAAAAGGHWALPRAAGTAALPRAGCRKFRLFGERTRLRSTISPRSGGMLRMSWRYAPWSTRLVQFQKPGCVRYTLFQLALSKQVLSEDSTTRTAIASLRLCLYVCCLCLMAFQNDALGSKLVEDGFVTRDVPFRAD